MQAKTENIGTIIMLVFLETKSEAARIMAIARLILLKKHKVKTIVPIPRHHQIID
jgi:hypothetical protein